MSFFVLVIRQSPHIGTKYFCVGLAVTGSSASQYGCARCLYNALSTALILLFFFSQPASRRSTRHHFKGAQLATPTAFRSHAYLYLDRRSTRFGYLSGLATQLSCLSIFACSFACRSSSHVDMTTVTLSHSPANRFAALNTFPVVANMFSVPLGIMFHADVRTPARYPSSPGT